MQKENQLALIDPSDLSLVEDNTLNASQLKLLLKKTPPQYIKKRPAKGGGQWSYVPGGYFRKVLNLMFGWDWDFEVVSHEIISNEAIVLGRLTCRVGDRKIVKMQFGNKEIMYKKGTEIPLSIGNDLKAAATDALKKCGAEIGIAADVYNAEDFKEVNVNDGKSNGEIDHDKNAARLAAFIKNATTVDMLITVHDQIEHYGMVQVYEAKMKELNKEEVPNE